MKRAIYTINSLYIHYKWLLFIICLSTAVDHLHSVLNHSNGTLLMDLVGAWQDLATAERILCKVQKVGLITTETSVFFFRLAWFQWTKGMYYKYGGTLFFATAQPGFAKTIDQKRIKVSYLRHKVLFVCKWYIKQSMFMQLSVEIPIPRMLIMENLNGTYRKFNSAHFTVPGDIWNV